MLNLNVLCKRCKGFRIWEISVYYIWRSNTPCFRIFEELPVSHNENWLIKKFWLFLFNFWTNFYISLTHIIDNSFNLNTIKRKKFHFFSGQSRLKLSNIHFWIYKYNQYQSIELCVDSVCRTWIQLWIETIRFNFILINWIIF